MVELKQIEGSRYSIPGMGKWLRENGEVGLNKACTGSRVHSLSVSPLPLSHPLIPSHLLAEPLVTAGPSQDPTPPHPHPHPPSLAPFHQPACQPGCRLCSLRPGLLLEKWQVCLLQSPPRNLNNQWPTTLPALWHRSSPPRAGSPVAGGQVEGSWGRLGAQSCPRAEIQGKFGPSPPGAEPQQQWGYRLGGAAQLQDRSDWYSHSLSLLKDQRVRVIQGHWSLGQDFRVHLTPSPVLYPDLQVSERVFFSSALQGLNQIKYT